MAPSEYRATTSSGRGGAASTAHPLATQAAVHVLEQGGTAADAAIAAQAVISVVLPQAAGLGGDLLALIHDRGRVAAVNGTGRSPRSLASPPDASGGSSVTVPGLVDGWVTVSARWGRLPLAELLAPAIELARRGIVPEPSLLAAVDQQRARLERGGAGDWSLVSASDQPWAQPELADLLGRIGDAGRDAFYTGPGAAAVVDAVRRCGGCLELQDLAEHDTPCPPPVAVPWGSGLVHVQPPISQGVLLAMALQHVRRLAARGVPVDDHLLVEVTGAAFEHRSSCGRGAELLDLDLDVDLERASGRAGPRAYLHTAGVATVDADGQVVSSLVSVFDDFGSGVFVPELGIVLNNRAAGFTDGDNSAAPGKRPVHTLAPAMVTSEQGVLGIATPGADGQIQTLLQVLSAHELSGTSLADAVGALRWRSQDGDLLIEEGHPRADALAERGHHIVARTPGADVFGAVVAAGTDTHPYAVADWRRETHTRGAA